MNYIICLWTVEKGKKTQGGDLLGSLFMRMLLSCVLALYLKREHRDRDADSVYPPQCNLTITLRDGLDVSLSNLSVQVHHRLRGEFGDVFDGIALH